MRTILVIAPHPALTAAVRNALAPERYRVIEYTALSEEELRLTASAVDACVLDVDLTTVEPIRIVERLRRVLPQYPYHPLRFGFTVELGGGRLPPRCQSYS